MSVIVRNEDKEKINRFPYHSKTHSTLNDKTFVTLFAENLQFLVSRAGWPNSHLCALYI